MRTVRFLANCIGLGTVLLWCYIWVRIAVNGGEVFLVFNEWYEWWIEPIVLVGFALLLVVVLVRDLRRWR